MVEGRGSTFVENQQLPTFGESNGDGAGQPSGAEVELSTFNDEHQSPPPLAEEDDEEDLDDDSKLRMTLLRAAAADDKCPNLRKDWLVCTKTSAKIEDCYDGFNALTRIHGMMVILVMYTIWFFFEIAGKTHSSEEYSAIAVGGLVLGYPVVIYMWLQPVRYRCCIAITMNILVVSCIIAPIDFVHRDLTDMDAARAYYEALSVGLSMGNSFLIYVIPLIFLVVFRPPLWSYSISVVGWASHNAAILHVTDYFNREVSTAIACALWFIVSYMSLWYTMERHSRTAFINQVYLIRADAAKLQSERAALENQMAAIVAEAKLAEEKAKERQGAYRTVVAATAHDLRTASSAVLSGCRVLTKLNEMAEEVKPGDRTRETKILESMSAMSKWAGHFLEGMAISSRLLAGHGMRAQAERIDIHELLHESLHCAKLACSSNGGVSHLVAEIAATNQYIYSDSRIISRNLLNLLSNASKHTHEGSIEIHTFLVDSSTAPELRIEVRDTGTGVPDSKKEKIFTPFVSMDDSTGLGLYVVRMQSEALGGSSGVKDNPNGAGSVFWFQIPYITPDAHRRRGSNTSQESLSDEDDAILLPGGLLVFEPNGRHSGIPAGSARLPADAAEGTQEVSFVSTILMIDDTVSVLDCHAEELTTLGHSITKVVGAEAGLQAMKANAYDLVLIDFKMPNRNGDEIVAEFREWETLHRTTVQVVFALSAWTTSVIQEKCRKAGMGGVVAKPMDAFGVNSLLLRLRRRMEQEKLRLSRMLL